ncbi:flavodoxin domain-containing protein [Streptomyces zingiberis]|uniref:Flavodoxin n=1 Tax=Streptomyces zingiberis TaxID=2053010 RepID=A0ABX1BUD1_9ACTN|nr:flavodoxin domain-containing protein [Streptomyces zingiberis]NJQ00155.1 flavodoxin [Streptomyces zingiberis]
MTPVGCVLVAYGSRNDATAEIADWIGEALHSEGFGVEVRPAAAVRDLSPYDAVVLGSALYANRWRWSAVRFARRHRDGLLHRPVWLFSSGPLDFSASRTDLPPPKSVARVAENLDARGHITFGGRLVRGTHGFVARQILKQDRRGDFRDPERVRRWGQGIAHELKRAQTTR